MNTRNTNTNTRNRRRQTTCSACNQVGHNRRSCDVRQFQPLNASGIVCSYCNGNHSIVQCDCPSIVGLANGILYTYSEDMRRRRQEPYSNLEWIRYHTRDQFIVLAIYFQNSDATSMSNDELIAFLHNKFVINARIRIRRRSGILLYQELSEFIIENGLEEQILQELLQEDTIYTRDYFKQLRVVLSHSETDALETGHSATGHSATGQLDIVCGICFDTLINSQIIQTNCKHTYCYDCIVSYSESIKDKTCRPNCPTCRGTWEELTCYHPETNTKMITMMEQI